MPAITNYFEQHGLFLQEHVKPRKATEYDLGFVRQWLDDAPPHAHGATRAIWGKLVCVLVHAMDVYNNDARDVLRVGAYLNAMAKLSMDDWWDEGAQRSYVEIDGDHQMYMTRPVYWAFFEVVFALGADGLDTTHRALSALVQEHEWEPEPLLLALHAMMEQQESYAVCIYQSCQFGIPEGHGTAYGLLLHALRPLVLDTQWRPRDTLVYGDVWHVHGHAREDEQPRTTQRSKVFTRRWLDAAPSRLPQVFKAMGRASDTRTVADFFPLPIAACPTPALVHALVGLYIDCVAQSEPIAHAVEQGFEQHHPELWSMVAAHAAVFSDADRALANAQVLVEGCDQLLGRNRLAMDNINTTLFEETT